MFRRRAAAPARLDDTATEGQYGPTAIIGAPINAPTPHVDGAAGWAPFGHGQAHSEQIGAYTSPPLNFYPALINDIQKQNGVSGLDSHWYVPTLTYVQLEQRAQVTSSVPNGITNVGGQRRGNGFTGLVGPISARLMRSRVTAAGVQQTQLVGDTAGLIQSWQPAPVMQASVT